MSDSCWVLNFPMYIPIPPVFELIAFKMVLEELAPFKTFCVLGGMPWQIAQFITLFDV